MRVVRISKVITRRVVGKLSDRQDISRLFLNSPKPTRMRVPGGIYSLGGSSAVLSTLSNPVGCGVGNING